MQSPQTIDPATEAFLADMVRDEHFSGAILVLQAGCVVHKAAYGPSSDGRPNHVDDRYHVGSLAKQFTAAGVLHLVERGRASLDAPINDSLPAAYRSDHWRDITLEHLLAHTSGIADYGRDRDYYEIVDGWAFGATINAMIREAMAQPPAFKPGGAFSYCNIGYTLLGEIIENVTGVCFSDFVKSVLFVPMGMVRSQVHDQNYRAEPTDARGLRWDDNLSRHVSDDVVSLPVTPADGGLITTLDDFARWTSIYSRMTHPNLSTASLKRMLKRSSPSATYRWPERSMRGEGFYGLGLMRSGDLVMHEGSIVGFRSYFLYSQADDLHIAVFSNNTFNDVFRITAGLFDLHATPR